MGKCLIRFSSVLVCLLIAGAAPGQYSGGDGSTENPWRISNKADLLALGANTQDYNDCFVMTADINMAGNVYTSALIAPVISNGLPPQGSGFKGVFDGNDFKITGLTIDGRYCLGVFGYIEGGKIRNLGIEDVSIRNGISGALAGQCKNSTITNCYSTGYVNENMGPTGGLVGINSATNISNCHSTASVGYFYFMGGLVGINADGSRISNCYSTGDVNGGNVTGGLVGYNVDSDISSSYSTSNIVGLDMTGGLVGNNDNSNISNCYSTGDVNSDWGGSYEVGGLIGYCGYSWVWNCYSISNMVNDGGGLIGYFDHYNISNCFWDKEKQSHGVTMNIGYCEQGSVINNVAGLTTNQMQKKSTYTSGPADWDFVNIWGIGEGQSYPYLRQYSAGDINQDKIVNYFDLAELANSWLKNDNQ